MEVQGSRTVLDGVIETLPKTAHSMAIPTSGSGKLSSQTFDELFLSTYPRLVAILRRMLGDSGRAEEIANEAFLKLYDTVLPATARANVPGWLYRTAMNMGIDDLRARIGVRHWFRKPREPCLPRVSPKTAFKRCSARKPNNACGLLCHGSSRNGRRSYSFALPATPTKKSLLIGHFCCLRRNPADSSGSGF